MSLRAYYNLFGYRVESDGVIVLESGNSPADSESVLPPSRGLPLHVIARFAREAAVKLAAGRGEGLEGGPRRDEEEEEAIARRHGWELPASPPRGRRRRGY